MFALEVGQLFSALADQGRQQKPLRHRMGLLPGGLFQYDFVVRTICACSRKYGAPIVGPAVGHALSEISCIDDVRHEDHLDRFRMGKSPDYVIDTESGLFINLATPTTGQPARRGLAASLGLDARHHHQGRPPVRLHLVETRPLRVCGQLGSG